MDSDNQVKIYDTVRGKQWLSRNGYGTVAGRSKKNKDGSWSSILLNWTKKKGSAKSSIPGAEPRNDDANPYASYSSSFAPASQQHQQQQLNKFCSLSVASSNVYLASPGHFMGSRPQATVRGSVCSPKATKRCSLFSSQWEPVHQGSQARRPASSSEHHHLTPEPLKPKAHPHQPHVHTHSHMTTACTCENGGTVRSKRSSPSRATADAYSSSFAKQTPESSSVDDFQSRTLRGNYQQKQQPSRKEKRSLLKKESDAEALQLQQQQSARNGSLHSFDNRYSDNPQQSAGPFATEARPRSAGRRVTGRATVNEKLLLSLSRKTKDPFSSVASRKSILENDLSAYDLLRQRFQLDADDDLSDNVLEQNSAAPHAATSAPSSDSAVMVARAPNTSDAMQSRRSSASGSHALVTPDATKSSDILSTNLRIGGQGMVLFAWNKPLKEVTRDSYNGGDYHPLSASSEGEHKDSDASYLVPEPDYDSSDDEPPKLSSANDSFKDLQRPYSPHQSTRLEASSPVGSSTRSDRDIEKYASRDEGMLYNHVQELKSTQAVAKSILKKPSSDSTFFGNAASPMLSPVAHCNNDLPSISRARLGEGELSTFRGSVKHALAPSTPSMELRASAPKRSHRRRARKHVTFRSLCDDTLVLEHINETPEEEYEEEPIYDDIYSAESAYEFETTPPRTAGATLDENSETTSPSQPIVVDKLDASSQSEEQAAHSIKSKDTGINCNDNSAQKAALQDETIEAAPGESSTRAVAETMAGVEQLSQDRVSCPAIDSSAWRATDSSARDRLTLLAATKSAVEPILTQARLEKLTFGSERSALLIGSRAEPTGNGMATVTQKGSAPSEDRVPQNGLPINEIIKPKEMTFTVSIVNKVNKEDEEASGSSHADEMHSYSSSSNSSIVYETTCSNQQLLKSDFSKYSRANKIVIDVPLGNIYEAINPMEPGEHIYEEVICEPASYTECDSPKKSIFDGASKDEILEYLEDAKGRVEVLIGGEEETLVAECNGELAVISEDVEVLAPIIAAHNLIESSVSSAHRRNRTSNVSNVSSSSTDSAVTTASSLEIDDEPPKVGLGITSSCSLSQLVERNDSGVGTETSKPSKLRRSSSAIVGEAEHQCTDCEQTLEPVEDEETGLLFYSLACIKCDKKRTERKEIISEFVETEFKYGRDLRIVREEFFRPMEVAGLLTKDQLKGVFINLDELIRVNSKFSEKLQDAIDIATEQGDEDFTTVNIGKLFMDSSAMLHAFETYCSRQGSASMLLTHLEKEKELLRIFLRVSQMENTLLRRMNLSAFLMVPVQRVTKYPLLLNRLYKVTPYHHRDRDALRAAQQKVELHLEHINQQTKSTPTKIWRRISNLSVSQRRLPNLEDIGNIKLRKAALESLKWNREEVQFVLSGKLLFSPLTDYQANKKGRTLKFLPANALLVTLGKPNENYRPDLVGNETSGAPGKQLMFPKGNTGITNAALLLMKDKGSRFALCREPLHLDTCVVSSESDGSEMFEIHEHLAKESYLFKADISSDSRAWFQQLCYHSKDLGNWRRRRNALANIMMVRQ